MKTKTGSKLCIVLSLLAVGVTPLQVIWKLFCCCCRLSIVSSFDWPSYMFNKVCFNHDLSNKNVWLHTCQRPVHAELKFMLGLLGRGLVMCMDFSLHSSLWREIQNQLPSSLNTDLHTLTHNSNVKLTILIHKMSANHSLYSGKRLWDEIISH